MKYEITNINDKSRRLINADTVEYGLSIIIIKSDEKQRVLKRNQYEIKEMK